MHRAGRLQRICFYGWQQRVSWKLRKRDLITASVALHFGNFLGPIFFAWSQVIGWPPSSTCPGGPFLRFFGFFLLQLARASAEEAQQIYRALSHWANMSKAFAMRFWKGVLETKSRYKAIAFTLASKNRTGVILMILIGWRRHYGVQLL